MGLIEIAATVFTVLCVLLAVKRSLWQYPVGFVGVGLYFHVFWTANLFASAMLQIVFAAVMLYGWWYWLFGDKGSRPPITRLGSINTAAWAVLVFGASAFFGSMLGEIFPMMAMAKLDAAIFGLSVLAQFYLDRKKIETWAVWAVVNVISIVVYAQQGLMVTTGLYAFLLANTALGYWAWKRELDGYGSAPATCSSAA